MSTKIKVDNTEPKPKPKVKGKAKEPKVKKLTAKEKKVEKDKMIKEYLGVIEKYLREDDYVFILGTKCKREKDGKVSYKTRDLHLSLNDNFKDEIAFFDDYLNKRLS